MAEETEEIIEDKLEEKIEKSFIKVLKKIFGLEYDETEIGDDEEEYLKFIDEINLEATYNDLNTIKELADKIKNLDTTLNSKIDTIKTNLESQISTLTTNINNQISTLTTNFTNQLAAQKSELSASVSELSTNVTNQLETQKNEITESVASNLEAQSNAISESLNAQSTALTESMNAQQETINASLNAQQETITASLNAQQETINNLFGQVAQVQAQTNVILQNLYNLIENELTTMGERRNIIRDCAITLFTNTNFDIDKRSPIVIAKDCVAKALLMTKEIKDQKIIE